MSKRVGEASRYRISRMRGRLDYIVDSRIEVDLPCLIADIFILFAEFKIKIGPNIVVSKKVRSRNKQSKQCFFIFFISFII